MQKLFCISILFLTFPSFGMEDGAPAAAASELQPLLIKCSDGEVRFPRNLTRYSGMLENMVGDISSTDPIEVPHFSCSQVALLIKKLQSWIARDSLENNIALVVIADFFNCEDLLRREKQVVVSKLSGKRKPKILGKKQIEKMLSIIPDTIRAEITEEIKTENKRLKAVKRKKRELQRSEREREDFGEESEKEAFSNEEEAARTQRRRRKNEGVSDMARLLRKYGSYTGVRARSYMPQSTGPDTWQEAEAWRDYGRRLQDHND